MRARALWAIALTALCCPLALSASSTSAGAAQGERYTGKTAQKFTITLSVGERRIQMLRFKIRLRCRDGSLLFDDLSDFEPARLKRGGRFSDLQFGPTDEVIARGRVGKGRVSGKLRVRDKLANGVPCDSGAVGFSAAPVAGRSTRVSRS